MDTAIIMQELLQDNIDSQTGRAPNKTTLIAVHRQLQETVQFPPTYKSECLQEQMEKQDNTVQLIQCTPRMNT